MVVLRCDILVAKQLLLLIGRGGRRLGLVQQLLVSRSCALRGSRRQAQVGRVSSHTNLVSLLDDGLVGGSLGRGKVQGWKVSSVVHVV